MDVCMSLSLSLPHSRFIFHYQFFEVFQRARSKSEDKIDAWLCAERWCEFVPVCVSQAAVLGTPKI